MKLTNLILSASVAAMTLVACNKQETTPQTGSSTLKTVEVSLENVIFTKGVAGPKVNDGDKVIVNTFQIFLTDASGNEYTGKTSTGAEAKSYWNQTDLAGGIPATADFPPQTCCRLRRQRCRTGCYPAVRPWWHPCG